MPIANTKVIEKRTEALLHARQEGVLDQATFERLFYRYSVHEEDVAAMRKIVADAPWRASSGPKQPAERAARAALDAIELELRCDPVARAAWAALVDQAIDRKLYTSLTSGLPTHSDVDALRARAAALHGRIARHHAGKDRAMDRPFDLSKAIKQVRALVELEAAMLKAGVKSLSFLEAMTCSLRAARAAGDADRKGTCIKLALAAGALAAVASLGHAIPMLANLPADGAEAFQYTVAGLGGLASLLQQLKLAVVMGDGAEPQSKEVQS